MSVIFLIHLFRGIVWNPVLNHMHVSSNSWARSCLHGSSCGIILTAVSGPLRWHWDTECALDLCLCIVPLTGQKMEGKGEQECICKLSFIFIYWYCFFFCMRICFSADQLLANPWTEVSPVVYVQIAAERLSLLVTRKQTAALGLNGLGGSRRRDS